MGFLVGYLIIGIALFAIEPLAKAYRRSQETGEETVARRRRDAMRLVNEAWEQDHPWWRN